MCVEKGLLSTVFIYLNLKTETNTDQQLDPPQRAQGRVGFQGFSKKNDTFIPNGILLQTAAQEGDTNTHSDNWT